jgi:hypothetical protein
MATVRSIATAATPPTEPPTMAPTLVPSSSSLFGAATPPAAVSPEDVLEASADDDDSVALVSLDTLVSPIVDDSKFDEEEDDDEDEVADVLLSVDVSVVRARVRVPIVVGSDKDVADAVKSTETLAMLSPPIPETAVATVFASDDAEPQPYWKNPSSNLF